MPSKEKKKDKRSKLMRKLGRSRSENVVSQSQRAPGMAGLLEAMRVQMEVFSCCLLIEGIITLFLFLLLLNFNVKLIRCFGSFGWRVIGDFLEIQTGWGRRTLGSSSKLVRHCCGQSS